jgi:hypothetical protein
VTAKYSDFTNLKDALDLTDGNLTRVRFTWGAAEATTI